MSDPLPGFPEVEGRGQPVRLGVVIAAPRSGGHVYVKWIKNINDPDFAHLRNREVKGRYLPLPEGVSLRWGRLIEVIEDRRTKELTLVRAEILCHVRGGSFITIVSPDLRSKQQNLWTKQIEPIQGEDGFKTCNLIIDGEACNVQNVADILNASQWRQRVTALYRVSITKPSEVTNRILPDLILMMKRFRVPDDVMARGLRTVAAAWGEDIDSALREGVCLAFVRSANDVLDKELCRTLIPDTAARCKLWLEGSLPTRLFDADDLRNMGALPVDIPKDRVRDLMNELSDRQDAREELLTAYLAVPSKISRNDLPEFMDLIGMSSRREEHLMTLIGRMDDRTLLDAWLGGQVPVMPEQRRPTIALLMRADDALRCIELYGMTEYAKLMSGAEEVSDQVLDVWTKHLRCVVEDEFRTCCLDLEVDARTDGIFELAYWWNGELHDRRPPSEQDIEALRASVLGADLVIGHNIRAFDLQRIGALEGMDPGKVWDTLEVEALLNPLATTYALRTDHTAALDVEHTLGLFSSQLARVLALDTDNHELLRQCLPKRVVTLLDLLQEDGLLRIRSDVLDDQAARYFRGQGMGKEAVPGVDGSVLVCPESLWCHFRQDPTLAFDGNEGDGRLALVLDRERIDRVLGTDVFLTTCLHRYLNVCEDKERIPFARFLPLYIVHRVERIVSLEQICVLLEHATRLMVSEWHFFENRDELLQAHGPERIVFVAPEHWTYASFRVAGSCDNSRLELNDATRDLWARFTNGVSSVSITTQQFREMTGRKPCGDKQWLTRVGFDSYQVLERLDHPSAIPGAEGVRSSGIALAANGDGRKHCSYIIGQYDEQDSFPLNPETLFRNEYWSQVLAKVLALGAMEDLPRPLVLVIEHEHESDAVRDALKALNYYVPSPDASLGRQVELALAHESGILVTDLVGMDRLLSLDLEEGCTFLLESLHPHRWAHLQEEEFMESSDAIDEDESEYFEEEDADGSDKDPVTAVDSAEKRVPALSAIRRVEPYYALLRDRVLAHHSENRLIALDPRAGRDTFGTGSALPIRIGHQVAQEVNDIVNLCNALFHAPGREADGLCTPEVIEEEIGRIATLFLRDRGDGTFRPAQLDYLRVVLPGNKDVLVTLPTGTGKSVLFQGPALFKSNRTGRLSVVVTPLKALMEDHVNGLHQLGFWNSVECVNSDMGGMEVQDIYRRLAGGELRMVFVAPERFRAKRFLWALEERIRRDGRLEYLVFDEAHCISQWGNEFRPDYVHGARCCSRVRRAAQDWFPILLLSATITKQVELDLQQILYGPAS